jgi:hypothetical protein
MNERVMSPSVSPTEKTEIDVEGPVSVKEILAQLDGVFPMDEAVIEGDALWIITVIAYTDLDRSVATRSGLPFCGELRYECLDNYRTDYGARDGWE